VLCAVLDPRNLTFPEVNTTDKSIKPKAFGIYLQKGKHLEGDEEDNSEEEKERRRIEGYKVTRIIFYSLSSTLLILLLSLPLKNQDPSLRKTPFPKIPLHPREQILLQILASH